MSDFTVEIKGMRELYEALSTKVPRSMEGRLLQKALAAGTAELVKAARRNAGAGGQFPARRTGTLRAAIYAKRGRTSTPEKEVRIVSVRRGKAARRGKKNRDAYYARWVEYGHMARDGKTKTGPPKFVQPKPFMRPAFDTTKGTAVDRILEGLRKQLEIAIAGARF